MRIAAYTYKADLYCETCLRSVIGELPDEWQGLDTEGYLDKAAEVWEIDRYDEHSYDSDDFPKVVFETQLEDDERCGKCGRRL
jgi:hypothetical protein